MENVSNPAESAEESHLAQPTDSARVTAARAAAAERRRRQRSRFRPLRGLLAAVVTTSTALGTPHVGLHGESLAVGVALACYLVALLTVTIGRGELEWGSSGPRIEDLGLVGIAGAGIALAALQPSGVVELPASAAVFIACLRFRPVLALAFSGVVVGGLLAVVGVESSDPATSISAVALLCIVLGFVADLAKRARLNQDRAELLLAELEDARESEALVVAAAERARIAGELHDVLAHSLSGLSIQLQFARKLAAQEEASPDLRQAVDQAAALTRDGLADARRAVGALRGDKLPTVEELPDLVERYRRDLRLDVVLEIAGPVRPLAADVSLAIYRGVQEALTNASRYAPTSRTSVRLEYGPDHVRLAVEDALRPAQAGPVDRGGGLAAGDGPLRWAVTDGGGNGLVGMRERAERAAGTVEAGPTEHGWLVEMTVPA